MPTFFRPGFIIGGATPLDPPTSLVGTIGAQTQINLTWTDNSGTAFEVYQNNALIYTTTVGATSYNVTGLTTGTTYVFSVRAVDGDNYSEFVSISATPGYLYGSPAGSGGTVGGGTVAAQWTFEEASGNAVDSANSISVPASGTIQRQVNTSLFRVGSVGASTGAGRFTTTTDPAPLALGTSNFVLECTLLVNQIPSSPTQHVPFDTRESASLSGIYFVITPSTGDVTFGGRTTSGVDVSGSWFGVWTGNTFPTDGIQKFRFYVDRAPNPGTVTLVYNGVVQVTRNLTGLTPSLSLDASGVNLGGRYDTFRNFFGVLKEIRVTTGTTTANSGGPGGG